MHPILYFPSLSLYLLNNEAENVGIAFSDAESLGGWPVSL